MGWLVAAVVLAAILMTVAYARLARVSQMYEIQKEKLIVPATTSVPMPEPTEAPKTWVRYDVPLSDDLQQRIEEICKEYGVEANVVMAIIEVESGCDPTLVGDNGHSWGLMQIYNSEHIPRCVRLGAWNLLDPVMNVRVGVDYLAELLNYGHGMEWALSFYNGHGGEPCDYALAVLHESERLLESAQTVEG